MSHFICIFIDWAVKNELCSVMAFFETHFSIGFIFLQFLFGELWNMYRIRHKRVDGFIAVSCVENMNHDGHGAVANLWAALVLKRLSSTSKWLELALKLLRNQSAS